MAEISIPHFLRLIILISHDAFKATLRKQFTFICTLESLLFKKYAVSSAEYYSLSPNITIFWFKKSTKSTKKNSSISDQRHFQNNKKKIHIWTTRCKITGFLSQILVKHDLFFILHSPSLKFNFPFRLSKTGYVINYLK